MPAFIVLTAEHACSAHLAIAASRAGGIGIVELPTHLPIERLEEIAVELTRCAAEGRFGVRCELGADLDRTLELIGHLAKQPWPVVLAGGAFTPPVSETRRRPRRLAALVRKVKPLGRQVWVEVTSLEEALAAEQAGCDALVVKGHEAAGRVGQESAFLLLQRLRGRVGIPYFIQGGIGPDNAAAAFLAGAAGVVLREQVWLATESPFDAEERRRWEQLDGSETATIGEGPTVHRFFSRADRAALRDIDRELASGRCCEELIREHRLRPGETAAPQLIPLGQEIAFARRLAEKHVNVAGILDAYRRSVETNLKSARQQKALAPEGPLAAELGIRYPVFQGPMTRVSDVAPFCESVSANGAMPFLALALMRGPETAALLRETQARMGNRRWGVGILGFVPAELRKAQLEAIREVCPPYAIIAGGRPSQAAQLEQLGISAYLHVPSPGLLDAFLKEGARRFIFEGRECGGHVGPRSSFTLWQSAIDVLLSAEIKQPEQVHVVFAGGIHDALSAAMVAALAAPLVERGMKIGVLMGTAYLFTREAVECGAIVPEFQRQALECRETVLLESGVGHATRCVGTPFANEFNAVRRELVRAGKSPDEIRLELELLNVGRLRIASKGVERNSDPRGASDRGELVAADERAQFERGMYMIGQVAALRDRVVPMSELHDDLTVRSTELLDDLASRSLPWQQQRPSRRNRPETHDIAVIGIGGMFPKARDSRRFWQNILNRLDAVREVPSDRWNTEHYFNSDRFARDQVYSKWGGFLEEMLFDPMKWMVPPATLESIEPVQFMALEVAWEALRDAGLDRRDFSRSRTGVLFAAAGSHDMGMDYSFRTLIRHYLPRVQSLSPESRQRIIAELESTLPEWTEDSFPGVLPNVIAGRISNRLNLQGPNYVVDAACAASLAALHAGIEQLRSGTTDVALVGAVDATNSPITFMSFAKTHALSPRGRSRPFDDSADGIALGEAVAAVVLKRLSDAERDGDRIYAVIKGIGASSDGKARSLTAPHPPGQVLALQRAYEDAAVDPSTITLIEAHGTGTAVGDSTEITSLDQMFSTGNARRQYVAVGSVKSMIGHTKSAAGLASLIKTVLALHQRVLPPTIGVEKPNTRIDFSRSPFYVNSLSRPWIASDPRTPRRAGVSAFGFGGTNFHVVLEEYTRRFRREEQVDLTPRGAELFVWKRETSAEIVASLDQLAELLASTPFDDLAAVASAAASEESRRRTSGERCRLAIVAESIDDLNAKLIRARAWVEKGQPQIDPAGVFYAEGEAVTADQVCFLYPGQGSQSVDMMLDLATGSPWSRALFEDADRWTDGQLPDTLSRLIYPPPAFTDAESDAQRSAMNDTRVAQPALGLLGLFATDLLARHNVRPACVAGHSYGEYVALAAAGVISRRDLFRLSIERGRIAAAVSETHPGAMAAIQSDAATIAQALLEIGSEAAIANLNAPNQTVIAGTAAAVDAAVKGLSERGFRGKRIPVSAAFHTSAMRGAAAELRETLDGVAFAAPAIPISSNTTASDYPQSDGDIRDLLTRHIAEPVQFTQQLQNIANRGIRVFIEAGPGRVLSQLVERNLDTDIIALSLDAPGQNGWKQCAILLGRLAVLGLPVDLVAWSRGRGLPELPLSEYAAQIRATRIPKANDWILTTAKAIPAAKWHNRMATTTTSSTSGTPSPAPEPASAAVVESPSAKAPVTRLATGPSPAAARPSADQPKSSRRENGNVPVSRVSPVSPRKTEMHVNVELEPGTEMTPAQPQAAAPIPMELAHAVQATMIQWIELQTSQQRVTEKFLALQEKLIFGLSDLPPAPRSTTSLASQLIADIAAGSAARAQASRPASSRTAAPTAQAVRTSSQAPYTPVVRKPQPVAPAVRTAGGNGRNGTNPAMPSSVSTNGTNGAAHGEPTATRAAELPKAAPATSTAVAAAPTSESPAPVEAPATTIFQDDLLRAVSERTGYPVEVLDLDAQLESGLGIDSIKTVEIFSKLKQYHVVFRAGDEDDEEILAEFARLKTLRDIVAMYDQRRQAFITATGTESPSREARAIEASSEPAGNVERHIPTAAEAPVPAGEKKNSLSIRSS